eukprot:11492948-Alexandrium_andersonii.AAC.1
MAGISMASCTAEFIGTYLLVFVVPRGPLPRAVASGGERRRAVASSGELWRAVASCGEQWRAVAS